jgi:DNA-binding NarL/FixJ family response regulator
VEIMLAVDDVPAARTACDELTQIAATLGAPVLVATAAGCEGAVLLAEGESAGALTQLRRSWTAWQQLDTPYEAARTRVLMALACREVGDEDSAQMELDAARWAFHRLGATGDLSRVDSLAHPARPAPSDGLTAREVEVLRLVATGRTNRAIAADLVLSEKTVQRHISNIFAKAGLSSRAAATAYAYDHGLV